MPGSRVPSVHEEVTEALRRLGHRQSTVERQVVGVDLGDEHALLEHAAARGHEHLDTQRWQILAEHVASLVQERDRGERPQLPPAPRPRPDGRQLGEGE